MRVAIEDCQMNYCTQTYLKASCHEQDMGSHDSDSTCQDKWLGESDRLKLKVELCRNFLENKICPYKSRCKFAHGLEQLLQNSELGQNFRTKKCKVFYDKKHCRFGQRCNFRHCEKKKEFKILTRSPKIIQEYPECFVGLRSKSKILEIGCLTNTQNKKTDTNQNL